MWGREVCGKGRRKGRCEEGERGAGRRGVGKGRGLNSKIDGGRGDMMACKLHGLGNTLFQ